MNRTQAYQEKLRELDDWFEFLLQECNIPGPRANLELAQAVAEEGTPALFDQYQALDASRAPANTPHEFVAFCGTLGLGRLLAEGDLEALTRLKIAASDTRWRIREAVVLALQKWGTVDMLSLVTTMETWSQGNLLEKRAAAAAVCEPQLLGDKVHAERVLLLLDSITNSLVLESDRRSLNFKILRKGLGYCWSVAVVAFPTMGKALLEKWFANQDSDIQWIMRENLRKARLKQLDPTWTTMWKIHLNVK